jgi:hypothetical protein
VFLDQRIFSVEGDGVKVQIEGDTTLQPQFPHSVKPGAHEFRIARRINATTVFRQERTLGDHV